MITVYKHSTFVMIVCWVAQLTAALIMLQTLYFKFSGAPESIYIFSKMGVEPWGRYIIGIIELLASVILLFPLYSWYGAAIGAGLMLGAMLSHLTVLGIEIMNDHGYLFGLAIVTFICCLIILFIRKNQIPFITRHF